MKDFVDWLANMVKKLEFQTSNGKQILTIMF